MPSRHYTSFVQDEAPSFQTFVRAIDDTNRLWEANTIQREKKSNISANQNSLSSIRVHVKQKKKYKSSYGKQDETTAEHTILMP